MRVIIVGAGQVGSSIAESLDADHEVIVIDTDGERVETLTYSLDVLAIEGDGASLETLREADVEKADLVIASTDHDETNIVTCATAKTVCDAFTIARVKRTNYLDTWNYSRDAFGVDFMVCTNLLAAETVVRVVGLPATQDVDVFADGRVLMAEFRIPEESPVAGQTVRESDRFDQLTFAAVLHGERVVIPEGETTLEAGDRLVVIGSPESAREFAAALAPTDDSSRKDVVIVGGGAVAFQTARLLETRGFHPRLVEHDAERARHLAEELAHTTVMCADATDRDFLERENINEADVVIAALDSDEKNLLVSLLAKRLGVSRTVAIVETVEYAELFETVGVDVAVNPRDATAEEIIRFTHEGDTENLALVEHDRAEVLEIEIDDASVLRGRPIRESAADLPARVTIGAITRDGELVTPRGDTVIEVDDHVVLFAETDVADAVTGAV